MVIGSWRSFLYSSSVHSSTSSYYLLPLLGPYSFCPLLSPSLHEVFHCYLLFLKRSLVFPIILFWSISFHWSLRKAFYLSLLVFGTLHSDRYIFSFLLCLSLDAVAVTAASCFLPFLLCLTLLFLLVFLALHSCLPLLFSVSFPLHHLFSKFQVPPDLPLNERSVTTSASAPDVLHLPFLDLSCAVGTSAGKRCERGLLVLATHPGGLSYWPPPGRSIRLGLSMWHHRGWYWALRASQVAQW